VPRRLLLVVLVPLALAACSGSDGDDESSATPATTVTRTETVSGAAPTAGGSSFDRIPEVVDEVEPSVVAVSTDSGEGSGVIWDAKGAIVTNYHVVAGATNVEVALASGARLPARIEAFDDRGDVAVLRVKRQGLPAATFEPKLPDVGELAIAMGNPAGFEQSVTAGVVSGLHRAIPSGGRTPALVDLIQTDAAISPGNSGGALVNAEGDVIGINVAYLPPVQSGAVAIGFAIPADTVVSIVRQLLSSGRVERAYLGVVFGTEITPDLNQQFGLGADEGVSVEEVPEGPAARAGIEPGDVIVSLDGKATRTVEDLLAALNRRRPGDQVTVGIVRDGRRRQIDVTLAERPRS
jgi:serine protease DegQ